MPQNDYFKKAYNIASEGGLEVSPGVFFNNLHNAKYFDKFYTIATEGGLTISKEEFKNRLGIGNEVKYMYEKDGTKVTPEQYFNKRQAPTQPQQTTQAPQFKDPMDYALESFRSSQVKPKFNPIQQPTPQTQTKTQQGEKGAFRLPTEQELQTFTNTVPNKSSKVLPSGEILEPVTLANVRSKIDEQLSKGVKDPLANITQYQKEQANNNVQDKYNLEQEGFSKQIQDIDTYSSILEQQLNNQAMGWDNNGGDFMTMFQSSQENLNKNIQTFTAFQTEKQKELEAVNNKFQQASDQYQNGTIDQYQYNAALEEAKASQKNILQEVETKKQQVQAIANEHNKKYSSADIQQLQGLYQLKNDLLVKRYQAIDNPEYADLKAKYSKWDVEQYKADESDKIRQKYLNGELSQEEIKKYTEDGTLQNRNAQAWFARTVGKLTSDILTLPRTFTPNDSYGWTDRLADWANRLNQDITMSNPYSSNLQQSTFQKIAVDPTGQYKVILDDDGEIKSVRLKDGYNAPSFVQEQIKKQYEADKSKFSTPKTEFNEDVLMKNAVNTMTDMGILILGSKGASSALKLGSLGQKMTTGAAIFGQVHNDIYNGAIEQGLSPSEASQLAILTGTGIAMVNYVNPVEYNLASNATRNMVTQADVALINSGKLSVSELSKQYVKGIAKNIVGENLEEVVLEPILTDVLAGSYGMESNEFDPISKEGLETMLITSLVSLPMGVAEVNKELPDYKIQSYKLGAENLIVYNNIMQDKLNKGIITQEEFDTQTEQFAKFAQRYNYTKGQVKENQRDKLVELLVDKSTLENNISTIGDKSLTINEQERLKEVDNELAQLLQQPKVKEQPISEQKEKQPIEQPTNEVVSNEQVEQPPITEEVPVEEQPIVEPIQQPTSRPKKEEFARKLRERLEREKAKDVKVESAVIEIGGKIYEGKNHAEAILKAKADGQDISQVNRQAEGKFKLSDGTIIDRAEAKTRFGQDRSELIIPQDEAAKQANKDYKKITEASDKVETDIVGKKFKYNNAEWEVLEDRGDKVMVSNGSAKIIVKKDDVLANINPIESVNIKEKISEGDATTGSDYNTIEEQEKIINSTDKALEGVDTFHLVENEGEWKATTKTYRGREIGNWAISNLDKKQQKEYLKIRDEADTYGTKEQAEENLKKLKDFEQKNKEAFERAKQEIDALKEAEERKAEERKKQQNIFDQTEQELNKLSDKEFDKLVELIDEKRRQALEQRFGDRVEKRTLFRTPISESYHKAKADGSNPELVKAVEELLSKEQPTQEEGLSPKIEKVESYSYDKLPNESKDDTSQLTENWRNTFEELKAKKDNEGIQILYNKLKVLQNGVIQGKAKSKKQLDNTLADVRELEKDIEDYAEQQKTKKIDNETETITEEPNSEPIIEGVEGKATSTSEVENQEAVEEADALIEHNIIEIPKKKSRAKKVVDKVKEIVGLKRNNVKEIKADFISQIEVVEGLKEDKEALIAKGYEVDGKGNVTILVKDDGTFSFPINDVKEIKAMVEKEFPSNDKLSAISSTSGIKSRKVSQYYQYALNRGSLERNQIYVDNAKYNVDEANKVLEQAKKDGDTKLQKQAEKLLEIFNADLQEQEAILNYAVNIDYEIENTPNLRNIASDLLVSPRELLDLLNDYKLVVTKENAENVLLLDEVKKNYGTIDNAKVELQKGIDDIKKQAKEKYGYKNKEGQRKPKNNKEVQEQNRWVNKIQENEAKIKMLDSKSKELDSIDKKVLVEDTKGKEVYKIVDVGEKIGGAKKDLANQLGNITVKDIESQPLSKSFPEPNYKLLVEEGIITKDEAIFLKYLYDNIPSKPRKAYRVASWVSKVQNAIDTFKGILGSETLRRKLINGDVEKNLGDNYAKHKEILEAFGFPENEINLGGYEITRDYIKGNYMITKGNYIIKDGFATIQDAVFALQLNNSISKGKGKNIKFNVYQDTKTKEYFIGKKGATGVVRVVEGLNRENAHKFLKDNQEKLESIWNGMKANPNERRLENRNRVGTDWRKGENISGEKFAEVFGFRGVEFGNWVNNSERQQSVNDAYDAFMDMANILGISPSAISLNGELGFAFGARGSGKHSAHYERDKVVINLTKTKGAGSLAHEWFHALDNYFARVRGYKGEFITDSPRQRVNRDGTKDISVRPEVLESFNKLVKAINASDLPKRSRKLDATRSQPYWSTTIEMGARAFENYLIEKLAENNESNDYLANFKELGEWINDSGESVDAINNFPYPLETENESINNAFQELFDVIQEKKEGDKTILFSLGKETKGKFTKLGKETFDKFAKRLKAVFPKIKLNTFTDWKEALGVSQEQLDLMFQVEEDYRGWHKAPAKEGKNSLDDMSDIFPDDLYSINGFRYYADDKNGKADRESYEQILKSRNKPNRKVKVYRAVPKGINKINSGDWVSLSKTYAKKHGENHIQGEYDILEIEIEASKLFNEGSINEFGVQFLRTPNGTVYGFVKDGQVFINENELNANTLVHEYGHIFAQILKAQYPTAHKNLIDRIKQEKALIEAKKKDPNYAKLTTEQLADEVLNELIGNKGETILNTKKPIHKEILDLLNRFWNRLKNIFTTGSPNIAKWSVEQFQNATIDDIVNNVTADLLSGRKLSDLGSDKLGGKSRFQIIGEAGAANLPIVRENLQVARDMEKAGKTPKEIFLATGWERTKDKGKWKYDLPDLEFKKGSLDEISRNQELANSDVVFDLVTYQKNEDGSYNLSLRKKGATKTSEFAEFKNIKESDLSVVIDDKDVVERIKKGDGNESIMGADLSDAKEINTEFTTFVSGGEVLPRIISAKELFEAYPKLKDAVVVVDKNHSSEGSYSVRDGQIVITLRSSSRIRAKTTLIHEIQHAIQDIEGFAKGGSPDGMIKYSLEQSKKILESEYSHLPSYKKAKSEGKLDEWVVGMANATGKGIDKNEAYKHLAGEVEARNAQTRAGMTPEERKQKMLSETEDVAEESKIYIYEADKQLSLDNTQYDYNNPLHNDLNELLNDYISITEEGETSLEDLKDTVGEDLYNTLLSELGENFILSKISPPSIETFEQGVKDAKTSKEKKDLSLVKRGDLTFGEDAKQLFDEMGRKYTPDKWKEIEPKVDEYVQKLLASPNFDEDVENIIKYISDTSTTELTESKGLATAQTMLLNKIAFHAYQMGKKELFKKVFKFSAERGKVFGQAIAAYAEASTPESLLNQAVAIFEGENDQVLNTIQPSGKTMLEELEDVLSKISITAEQVEQVLKQTEAKRKGVTQRAKKPRTQPTQTTDKPVSTKQREKANDKIKDAKARLSDWFKENMNIGFAYNPKEEAEKTLQLVSILKDLAIGYLQLGTSNITYIKEQIQKSLGDKIKIDDVWSQVYDDEVSQLHKQNQKDAIINNIVSQFKDGKTSSTKDVSSIIARSLALQAKKISGKKSTQTDMAQRVRELLENKDLARQAWEEALSKAKEEINAKNIPLQEKIDLIHKIEDAVGNFIAIPQSISRKAIRKGMKDVDTTIDDLIKSHFTQKEAKMNDIVKAIVDNTGLSLEDSIEYYDILYKEFNDMLSEKQTKQLKKTLYPKKITRKQKNEVQKMVEAINMGALGTDSFIQAFGEKFGLKKLNEEQVANIKKFTDLMYATDGEMRRRLAKELSDYIDSLKPMDARNIGRLLNNIVIHHALSGITTIAENIPIGSTLSTITNLLPVIIMNPIRTVRFLGAYNKAGLSGTGTKALADTLRSGYNDMDFFLTEDDMLKKGSRYYNFINKLGFDNPKDFLASVLYKIPMHFAYMASAFDNIINHRGGELLNFIDEYKLASKEVGDVHTKVLERMGYDKASTYGEQVDEEIEDIKALGMKVPIGYKERRVKELMVAGRNKELQQQAYETIKTYGLMGQPDSILGFIYNHSLKKWGNIKDTDNNLMVAIKTILNITLGMFTRITVAGIEMSLKSTPIFGLMMSAYKYDSKTDKFRATTWEEKKKALAMQAMITGTLIAILAEMFDYDDDELKLNPNRRIDITGSKIPFFDRETLQGEDGFVEPLSFGYRKKDGTMKYVSFAKYIPVFVPLLAFVGNMRDKLEVRDTKQLGKEEFNTNSIKVDASLLLSLITDTFSAQNVASYNTIGNFLTDMVKARSYHNDNPDIQAEKRREKVNKVLFKTFVSRPGKTLLMPNLYKSVVQLTEYGTDATETMDGVYKNSIKEFYGLDHLVNHEQLDMFGNEVKQPFPIFGLDNEDRYELPEWKMLVDKNITFESPYIGEKATFKGEKVEVSQKDRLILNDKLSIIFGNLVRENIDELKEMNQMKLLQTLKAYANASEKQLKAMPYKEALKLDVKVER